MIERFHELSSWGINRSIVRTTAISLIVTALVTVISGVVYGMIVQLPRIFRLPDNWLKLNYTSKLDLIAPAFGAIRFRPVTGNPYQNPKTWVSGQPWSISSCNSRRGPFRTIGRRVSPIFLVGSVVSRWAFKTSEKTGALLESRRFPWLLRPWFWSRSSPVLSTTGLSSYPSFSHKILEFYAKMLPKKKSITLATAVVCHSRPSVT